MTAIVPMTNAVFRGLFAVVDTLESGVSSTTISCSSCSCPLFSWSIFIVSSLPGCPRETRLCSLIIEYRLSKRLPHRDQLILSIDHLRDRSLTRTVSGDRGGD